MRSGGRRCGALLGAALAAVALTGRSAPSSAQAPSAQAPSVQAPSGQAPSAQAPPAQAPAAQVAVPTSRPLPEPKTASLGWVRLPGASACASGAEIARRVEGVLRREALVPATRADLAIEARVERVPARRRFRAIIQVHDGQGALAGERTLESRTDDCHRLDDQVALTIALMIDPDAVSRAADPVTPPPTAPLPPFVVRRDVVFVPVPIEPPPPPPPPPRPLPEPPEAPPFAIAAGPTLALGMVPGPAAGARVALEFGPPADVDAERVTWGPSSLRVGFAAFGGEATVDGPSRRATLAIDALMPRLEGCPTTVWALARVAFGACAALEVGVLRWTGEGFDSPVASGTRAAAALGPSAHTRVRLAGPLALEVRAAALAPLVRDRFVYGRAGEGSGLAYEPGAVGLTLDAGLHLAFGP